MNHALPLALASLLAAASAAVPAPARAADDVAQARAHFDKGAKLFRAAKYREAIGEFETAYRLKPHGAIHFNVAQCRERLEEWPNALRSYQDYLREVPDASDRAAVRASIQKIEQRIAKAGVQALLVYSDPPGAVVKVDGKAHGRTPFHITLPPGVYKVGLSLDGFQGEEVEAELTIATSRLVDVVLKSRAAAARKAVDVPLPPPPIIVAPGTAKAAPSAGPAAAAAAAPAEKAGPGTSLATGVPGAEAKPAAKLGAELVVKPPEPSPLQPPRPPPPGPTEKRRVYTWVAVGAAAAAGIAGVVLGSQANSENRKIVDGTIRTTEQITAMESSRDKKARTANVLYGVAGAAAAAGVTLFFIEGSF